MNYRISCRYKTEECVQIIDVPHAGAAKVYYESIMVRQPAHPEVSDYTSWKLEKMPVEAALVAEGETETEKEAREIREKLAAGKPLC